MCLVKYEDGTAMIHLETDSVSPTTGPATLCGQIVGQIVDRNVATGWPDCPKCIELAEKSKPPPSYLV